MLAPWKENYDKHSVLKSRDITWLTKVHLVKAVIFPVVMYRYESRLIKKAKRWRTDAFKLWCWRWLLRVPRTAGRSNQSILNSFRNLYSNIFNLDYTLEGLMLKLQYFGYLMWSADILEKTLTVGKTEGKRRRGRQRMRLLDSNMVRCLTQWTWTWADSGRWWRA